MKIKEGCAASTAEFWYDLTSGGYLKLEEILEDKEDIRRVKEAIEIICDFEQSCEEQIEDFIQ
jgi:hypothetical protein